MSNATGRNPTSQQEVRDDDQAQQQEHRQRHGLLLARTSDEVNCPVFSGGLVEGSASPDAGATGGGNSCTPPSGSGDAEDAHAGAHRRPAVLNLQSLLPRGASDAGGGDGTSENGDEPSPTDCIGGSNGGTSSRRGHFSNHHRLYHRQLNRSPSLTGSMAGSCSQLQAVPEDAVVNSPTVCDTPGSGGIPSGSLPSGGLPSGGSPAPLGPRSVSSSFCSEISIDSPNFNLTIPCQEMPTGMLVAMVDRSAEMRELYERNAPFFEQVTSGVLGYTPPPSSDNIVADELPPRVKHFFDILFAPREQLPDRLWIDTLKSQLVTAPPAVVETFRELVGYESEEEYDDRLPECDQIWLPEHGDPKDAGALGTAGDVGAESDTVEDTAAVSRRPRQGPGDGPGIDKASLGRVVVDNVGAVTTPAAFGFAPSADKLGTSLDAKKERQDDEERNVVDLAV